MVYRKDFNEEMNRDNLLLWRNTTLRMDEYNLRYKGAVKEVEGFPVYVKKEFLTITEDPFKSIANADLSYEGKTYFKKGDTLKVAGENTYFAVEFSPIDTNQDPFVLYPRAQVNPSMGLMASPDIRRFWSHDLYTHVSSIPPPDQEREWEKTEEHKVSAGDTFFVAENAVQLVDVIRLPPAELAALGNADAAVKAVIRVFGLEQNFIAESQFVIRGTEVGTVPGAIEDLGLRFTLKDIDPATGKFTIEVETSVKDWIILKAIEKPGINVLWIGTMVVVIGLAIAIRRRYREFALKREKNQEILASV
jgi:cytochrome c-type biogenesis protein CcmF